MPRQERELIDWYRYENEARAQGFSAVCGVDEAGRGPLAGPVFAAAVILPEGERIEGLDDSKRLSEKRRESLFPEITARAAAFSIASASEEEIDSLNILQATMLAMRRAVESLSVPPNLVLVDGNREPPLPCPVRTIVGGDGLSASIAAASILAKVSRDRRMRELASLYPEYGFDRHKGYGTKDHYAALRCYGPSPIHRRSFLKNLQKHGGVYIGGAAEDAVAAYLTREGWTLLARNFHSREGELDIVARRGDLIAFVEVRARSGNISPAETVDAGKRKRLVLCAQQFLFEHPECEGLEMRFDVAEVHLSGGTPAALRILPGAFTLNDL